MVFKLVLLSIQEPVWVLTSGNRCADGVQFTCADRPGRGYSTAHSPQPQPAEKP